MQIFISKFKNWIFFCMFAMLISQSCTAIKETSLLKEPLLEIVKAFGEKQIKALFGSEFSFDKNNFYAQAEISKSNLIKVLGKSIYNKLTGNGKVEVRTDLVHTYIYWKSIENDLVSIEIKRVKF